MKMFLSLLFSLLSFVGTSVSFADANHPEEHFAHLPNGGRKGLHGMVVFGSGPYFLEHIPMLTPPHDFQIIVEVNLINSKGAPVRSNFSNGRFTLKPSADFSLNDFVAGRKKSFTGAIYPESFEEGTDPLLGFESVTVQIQSYKLIRQLPSSSEVPSIQLTDGKDTFESNLIRPEQNVQLIRNKNTGKALWCAKAPEFFKSCL